MSSDGNQESRKQETKPRAKRGHFDWEVVNNRLRLVVPEKHSPTGQRIRPALHLKGTPGNIAKAEVLVEQLNSRVFLFENYNSAQLFTYIDEFFGRTKTATNSSTTQKPSSKEFGLDVIWLEFIVAQESAELYKATTLLSIFPTITEHIKKMTTRDLSEHEQIFTEIKKLSKSARYRTMIYISAACNWAVKKGKIKENPFSDYPKRLGVPKSDKDPDPLTRQESMHILNAYRKHTRYYYFADFVEFKLRTGCRSGEGVALKWKNVNLQEGWIYFCESITYVKGKPVHTVGTKNGTTVEDGRYFKIESSKLKELLERLKPSQYDPEGFVFQGLEGGHVNYDIFYYSWYGRSGKDNGIIHKLIAQGLVHHYRPPYNTRHTFISLAVDKIFKDKNSIEQFARKLATLAKRVGNSASMILEHYLGLSDNEGMLDVDFDEELTSTTQTSSSYEDLLKQLAVTNRQLEEANQLNNALTAQLQEANQRSNELFALLKNHLLKDSSSTHQALSGSNPLSIPTAMSEDSLRAGTPTDIELEQLLLFVSLEELID